MYSKIVKYINFPLYSFLSGRHSYYRHYRQLEKNQWLPSEYLEKLRWKLFIELMEVAYTKTNFYKKVMDHMNADPRDFNSMKSYQKIPILNKQIIQRERERLKSKNLVPGSFAEDASGGSTGEPTIFYVHNYRYTLRAWEQVRHDRWSGWDLGENMALLWGASYDLRAGKELKARAKNFLLHRRISMDAFALTDKKMENFAKMMVQKRPTMLLAYANAAYIFAQYLHDIGFPARTIGLRGIVSSAEKLYDFQRGLIERVFGCPVFDLLGSREVGLIGSECDRHEGLHLNADNLIIEFLDEENRPVPQGEPGRIVVTDLLNKAMPFIRYDTGDIGIWTERPCSCGRTLPLMKCVEGRTVDFILTKDGRKIHGEYFTHLFYGVRGLRQFQLIQKDLNLIEIKIIKTLEWDACKEPQILEKIRSYMQDSTLKINLVFVDQIPKPPSGKLRFTMSELIQ
jgi:phenylacetate-CoA ligase